MADHDLALGGEVGKLCAGVGEREAQGLGHARPERLPPLGGLPGDDRHHGHPAQTVGGERAVDLPAGAGAPGLFSTTGYQSCCLWGALGDSFLSSGESGPLYNIFQAGVVEAEGDIVEAQGGQGKGVTA